jgi:hypothetical protein
VPKDAPDDDAQVQNAAASYVPPDLPEVNSNLFHIVVPATGVWFVGLVVLLVRVSALRADHHLIWLWTAAAGTFLGGLGLGVYGWQRSAARRGRRSAQQMALQEKI